eukprot:768293-Hanusia_phi.AAC.7
MAMDFLFAERNASKSKAKFHLDLVRGDVASAEKIVSFFNNLRRKIVNEYDDDGYLPIHHAAAAGKVASCEFLIKNKCDLEQTVHPLLDRSSLRTCLHFAAISRNIEVISLLLKHGADPHKKDALQQRPIDLAKDASCWQLLKRAMNTQSRVSSCNLLLEKISAAFNCIVRVPSTKMSSNHAERLEKSYTAWEQEVNGKHPPYKLPSLSWMQAAQSSADVGMILVLIKNVEKMRKIPLNGLIRAQSFKYHDNLALEICDVWVRQDCRKERIGSVLLFALFVAYAKKNYKSAACKIHTDNLVAKAFFKKFGFRKMITSIPRNLMKANFEAFELRDIGDSLERFQVVFADYKNIAILDDDYLMEEAKMEAEDARNRRIEEKKERQKVRSRVIPSEVPRVSVGSPKNRPNRHVNLPTHSQGFACSSSGQASVARELAGHLASDIQLTCVRRVSHQGDCLMKQQEEEGDATPSRRGLSPSLTECLDTSSRNTNLMYAGSMFEAIFEALAGAPLPATGELGEDADDKTGRKKVQGNPVVDGSAGMM